MFFSDNPGMVWQYNGYKFYLDLNCGIRCLLLSLVLFRKIEKISCLYMCTVFRQPPRQILTQMKIEICYGPFTAVLNASLNCTTKGFNSAELSRSLHSHINHLKAILLIVGTNCTMNDLHHQLIAHLVIYKLLFLKILLHTQTYQDLMYYYIIISF